MKDVTKKVVILDNISSPYVHQAIIIMRDYNPRMESHAVIEAERIVNAYLDNVKINNGQFKTGTVRRKRHINYFLLSAAVAAVAAAALIWHCF